MHDPQHPPRNQQSSDLADARDALSAAAALGVEISAPVGTYVYEVSTSWLSEDGDHLGLFTSEAAAYAALRNHVLYGTELEDAAPQWTGAADGVTLRDWLADKSAFEVVTVYYSHFRGESFTISKLQVAGDPGQPLR